MTQVHAHIHKRTRTKKAKQTKAMNHFDKVVIAMGILNLFATLPQIITIWGGRDATGVSTLSWGYYSLFCIVLLAYGIMHKARPIVATYTGSTLLYMVIFAGSIIY